MICLEPVQSRGFINVCDHVFCCECILRWSTINNCCPACKRVFTEIKTFETSTTSPSSSPRTSPTHITNTPSSTSSSTSTTTTSSSISTPSSTTGDYTSISSPNSTTTHSQKKRKYEKIYSVSPSPLTSLQSISDNPSTDIWFDFVNNDTVLAEFISRLSGDTNLVVDPAEYRSLFYRSIISGLGLNVPNNIESIELYNQINQTDVMMSVNTIEDCKESYV